jgi:tetratricopeptide (TPR) repeat protein
MNALNQHFRRLSPSLLFAGLLFLPQFQLARAAEAEVTARTGQIELPTYPWSANKYPYFEGTDGVNVYPYPMLDFLSRQKTNRTYRTVILENEYLRISFLPELGGKIYEVLDKTTGQPMFYVNHVVKPGLIGECGAWTSGGVEWNTGPQGHTVSCMQPVDVEILPPARDGSRSVAIGETEGIYGTRWTVVVTLRPHRAFIEERIRIYNPTDTVRPYYFWNDTASPDTPGFRFIYPMTLGCDHAGVKFFHWPIDHGIDLSRGANYQDASSIFAWYCNQDFFGSYNDDLDHGVVSCANHYQLPGKKAWTWGHGSYGTMHQMDLTDNDGPYNEIQTGPLLTQAQVGRLDPCEAVGWKEWWYPIQGIGGFTYANKDVAVNARVQDHNLQLRMMGTGTWDPVEVRVSAVAQVKPPDASHGSADALVRVSRRPQSRTRASARQSPPGQLQEIHAQTRLSPARSTRLALQLPAGMSHPAVELIADGKPLARFTVPLDLPVRTPPKAKPEVKTPAQIAQAGWEDYLFARDQAAQAKFQHALALDSGLIEARTGLAFLNLVRDPAAARRNARAALATDPECGLAHFALAAASLEEDDAAALDHAWAASLDPASAVPARALVAGILSRRGRWQAVVDALSAPGPWQTDPLCRDRNAFAHLKLGQEGAAARLARANLNTEPLDGFALSILWLADQGGAKERLEQVLAGRVQPVLDVASDYCALKQYDLALRIIKDFYLDQVPASRRDPIPCYWAQFLASKSPGAAANSEPALPQFDRRHEGAFPHRLESVAMFRAALQRNPHDALAALYLGDVLFHLRRYAEGRKMWERAAKSGDPQCRILACRSLGMAARTLDEDLAGARRWLEKANQADPKDAIVARDLANVLFALADKTGADSRQLTLEARDKLQAALEQGKGRSDFVALLARAENRLGDFGQSARMLDAVRVTIWEGAHEVHDLFEQAHLALGDAQLKAGQPAAALAQFNRALEYPANLATGKLEATPEAQIQYRRGEALAALGRKAEAIAAWKLAANEPASGNAQIEAYRQKARKALERR